MLEKRSNKTITALALAALLAVLVSQSQNLPYALVAYSSAESSSVQVDKFGIEEIYPTKDGREWYVNMDDPRNDPNFRNLNNINFAKNADGSWKVSADQIRMEAWSPENAKWKNVEITEYAKINSGSNELLQMYSRGGHHTSKDPCLGSAYKARLYGDGTAAWNKEITHPAYAGNRGVAQATTRDLEARWVGFKAIIYNFEEGGKTFVRLESYIDDDVTNENGNLIVKNNWKLASVYEDRGGWSTHDGDFDPSCGRDRDEIMTESGGTSAQNIAAFRSDDLTWSFKYLSVREIEPPIPDAEQQIEQPGPVSEDNTERDGESAGNENVGDNGNSSYYPSDFPIIAGQHFLFDDGSKTTINGVRLYMERNDGSGGDVTIQLSKDGQVLSSYSIDANILEDGYTSITAQFPSIVVSGSFDISVLYTGTASIDVHRSDALDIPGNYFDSNGELVDSDLAAKLT